MDLHGVLGIDSGVRHIWAIGVVILCIIFAIKGYFASTRAWALWKEGIF